MKNKQFCPEINDCARTNKKDIRICLNGYQICHEYQKRQEHKIMQTYGNPLGIGAMTAEGIERLFEKQTT